MTWPSSLELVDPAPFLQWFAERRAHHERVADGEQPAQPGSEPTPLQTALAEIGWAGATAERRLSRWRLDPPAAVPRAVIEDALFAATGHPWLFYELYAADYAHELAMPVAHGDCERCDEPVLVDPESRCLWCSAPTMSEDAAPALAEAA